MKSEKKTGSYYTPLELIHFMIAYLENEQQDFSKVLEPSVGDGRFLPFLLERAEQVKAIEISKEKAWKTEENYANPKLTVEAVNFLDFISESEEKYSLIIGNPPYINLQVMEKEDIEKGRQLCREEELPSNTMQNMWLAFVLGAVRHLSSQGSIFFVLPMEFLQVQYAEKLRTYLEKKFNTIHIISFREPVFENIEQDVCLAFLTNREEETAYILYEIYDTIHSRKPIQTNTIKKNKPLKKWSNAILEDEEISLLRNSESRYKKINEFGMIAPGIVTGGNNYFVLNRSKVEELDCKQYTLPIILKPSYISKRKIEINHAVVRGMENKDIPCFLLNLSAYKDMNSLPESLQKYLIRAGNEKVQGIALKNRFKCANRSPWYGVPVVKSGDVIFFKRYDSIPKIYINKAGVHTADTGYHIRLNPEIDPESFVFCFFNSMTLAHCEFGGRYYGGGVIELVPSEFRNVVIPYRKIEKKDVIQLKKMFYTASSVKDIIDFVNHKTIFADYTKSQVENFERIRMKLIHRRV